MASPAKLSTSLVYRCITLSGNYCCLDTKWLLEKILIKDIDMPECCPACKGNGSICRFDIDVRDVINGIK